MKSVAEKAKKIFECAQSDFDKDRWHKGMGFLFRELTSLRHRSTREEWQSFCRTGLTEHPITAIIHQDPITRHSFMKPRGYPGDADLLDLIYRPDSLPNNCSRQGAEVWSYTVHASEAVAVRERRDMLAKLIDDEVVNRKTPRILSVACGHLREFGLSRQAMHGAFVNGGIFHALDQDKTSLAEVNRCFQENGVQTIHGSVKLLLKGDLSSTRYDLIYAAGLYDYLSDAMATCLTDRMFELLSPGGRLLIANFAPGCFGTGYVESFMDWQLIYRDEGQLANLASGIAAQRIAKQHSFASGNCHIEYLELTRTNS